MKMVHPTGGWYGWSSHHCRSSLDCSISLYTQYIKVTWHIDATTDCWLGASPWTCSKKLISVPSVNMNVIVALSNFNEAGNVKTWQELWLFSKVSLFWNSCVNDHGDCPFIVKMGTSAGKHMENVTLWSANTDCSGASVPINQNKDWGHHQVLYTGIAILYS